MNAVAYQFAVLEMFETLQYIRKEWEARKLSEGAGRLDQINMDHVNAALALATPVLTNSVKLRPVTPADEREEAITAMYRQAMPMPDGPEKKALSAKIWAYEQMREPT